MRDSMIKCNGTRLVEPRSTFLSPVAAREAARDPGASDRERAADRSRHHVLHPQARESVSPVSSARHPRAFTILCFLETGHQLDWTD